MKPLTEKQKKYLWIAAGVLVALHFMLPRVISFFHAPSVHSASAKPSPYVYAPVPHPQPPPPPAPEALAFTRFGGVWAGETITPELNRCGIHLEVKLTDDSPKQLKGFLEHRCISLESLKHSAPTKAGIEKMIAQQTQPDSAVMTGTPAAGGINFAVDQMLSDSADKCGSIDFFNIVDFGSGLVMAEWQRGSCDTQKMLLKKAAR